VIGLSCVLLDLRDLELGHVNHRLLDLALPRRLLRRCRRCLPLGSSRRVLLLLLDPLCFLQALLLFILLKGLFFELLLPLLGLLGEEGKDLIALRLVQHAELRHAVLLKVHKEGVHGLRMCLHDLDVLNIVVPVGLGDLVEQVKAVLQLLIKLNVMYGATHLLHLG